MTVKMLNWVQKKLNWGSDYHRVSSGKAPASVGKFTKSSTLSRAKPNSSDVFSEDERKGGSRPVACGERNNGTLRHSMLGDILAIGTFNHSHRLLSYSTVEEYIHEEVKGNDLRMVTMLQTTGTLISSKYHPPSSLKPLQGKPSVREAAKDDKKDHKKMMMMEMVMVEQVQHSSCELLQPLLEMDKEREEKTTLADLLAIEANLSRNYSS